MRKIQVGDLVKTTWADPYSDMPTAGVFGLVIGMSDENRNLSKEKIEYTQTITESCGSQI